MQKFVLTTKTTKPIATLCLDNHIDDELIVGTDVINQSKLTMTKDGITMNKIKTISTKNDQRNKTANTENHFEQDIGGL